jgi:predicted permease
MPAVSLWSALTTAILPVLSVAAVGYLLGSFQEIDVEPLSTVTIYVLTPALVFHSLTTTPIGGEVAAKLFVGVAVFTLVMAGLAEGVGRLRGEEEPVLGALVLTSVFPNAGNYGIPLSAFAFGGVGRTTAVLFLAAQAVMMYTVGVYLASRGQAGSTRRAVTEVFKLPLVYAVVAAGLAGWLGVVPPEGSAAMETIRLTGDSAIPVMLVLLGIQLANSDYGALARVGTANVLKLMVAPLVGVAIVLGLGLGDSTVARVFVLECGMPAAITPLLLAVEFGSGETDGVSGPEYVSAAIFTTTLLSVVTLTVLIAILQAGMLM